MWSAAPTYWTTRRAKSICSGAWGWRCPSYAHVPVLTEPDDAKLAKSRRSVGLEAQHALPQLLAVFSLLGLAPPRSLEGSTIADAWDWAIAHWDIGRVPKRLNLRLTG